MIEITNFCAVRKKNSIAQPIETIGQDDFALSSGWCTIEVNIGDYLVAVTQVDLTLVGVGKCVGLPKCHVSIIAGMHPEVTNSSGFISVGDWAGRADTLRTL